MSTTVIKHVISRLHDLGIKDFFGVPGDFAFPIEDTVCENPVLRWIGNCNELNAAYAADGYARVHGMAALSTTFAVGELSALNGIAGSYAESLPVFHLVGMPSSKVIQSDVIVHHTLGDGNFTLFYDIAQKFSCAHAILTPENCVDEMERLISAALRYRKPVYIGLPTDYAEMQLEKRAPPQKILESHRETLSTVVDTILGKLKKSQQACLLPGIQIARYGLEKDVMKIIEKFNLPFSTMLMDKTTLDEEHQNYIGIYNGHLLNHHVADYVESCDCIINVCAMNSDFNTGAFTANMDRKNIIYIMPESVQIDDHIYENVILKDVLQGLITCSYYDNKARNTATLPQATKLPEVAGSGKITADYIYSRWQKMLKPDDILIAETGTVSMGLGFALMPKGAKFHNQTLWGAIGWATPAAFGAALAAPEKRTILVTGEGSHQLTAQEISQFHRFNLKPIIFVLNNDGYLIERLLCKDGDIYYNDLAQWDYSKLPDALGCKDWFCTKVTSCEELEEAILKAESCGTGAYIEVITDKYEASPLADKLHASIETLYAA